MSARDMWRYVLVIFLTFSISALSSIGEAGVTALLILKHGAIACIPTLTALRMTLERDLSDVTKPFIKGAGSAS